MGISAYINSLANETTSVDSTYKTQVYKSLLRTISAFESNDISFSTVFTPAWMDGYRQFLQSIGYNSHVITFFMQSLLSVYKNAVEDGVVSAQRDILEGVLAEESASYN